LTKSRPRIVTLNEADRKYYPVLLRTEPPTLLTYEEVRSKLPRMCVMHVPATHPRDEG
jgi:hypothetical protein